MSASDSAVADRAAAPPRAAETLTPTFRQRLRSWRFWIVVVLVVVAGGGISTALNSATLDATPFGAGNPGPTGAKALVEVLRQQGVDVMTADTIGEAQAAVADPAAATVLVYDADGLLDAERIETLGALATHLVLVAPPTPLLDSLAPGIALGGSVEVDDALEPGCDAPAAVRAGPIVATDQSVQPVGDSAAVFCYADGEGLAQYARVDVDGRAVDVLAGTSSFDNESIATAGNAALALGLLGDRPTLVWYQPTFADLPVGAPPTTAELTPEWVTPVLLTLIAVFVAAALWRGRRLGPLVVEDLPVVVRAGETIEGRARLYRRSSARLHALDSLRIGSIGRLAAALRLPTTASTDAVVRATAAALQQPTSQIAALLVDQVPGNDAELVRLSGELLRLERAVHDAVRIDPDPSSPTARDH
ncbi:DUF4350 domain-containing protein [Herbiconiux sp. L3-i23]|uniref:DUF4350 domain-containing protein n=1 Tax=Herbiconiux sp. L3-i23 TaxID=2905871 RepID=UPI00206AAD27|nr:DUF4350 domain-containing protein [Herbiconiux sp. L3-i23]BDI21686.1 membrane protein [Herbiconiux sp. L3-i23]